MRSPALAATPLLASIAWTVALMIDGAGRGDVSVLLIGIGLHLMSVVAVAGMVVASGRWARRLGLVTVAGTILIAATRPVDPAWGVALALSALAIIGLNAPSVTGRIRQLPSAEGPPTRAVLSPLALLATPLLIGVVSWDDAGWAEMVVGLSAPIIAFAYARVIPGALIMMRLIWPALAVALSFGMPWPAAVTSAAMGVGVALVAWDPSVKVAYRPPRETGTTYPIPPELAPREILDAANIDEKGRRR